MYLKVTSESEPPVFILMVLCKSFAKLQGAVEETSRCDTIMDWKENWNNSLSD